ncbi:MAG TPA: lasso peptide biosynthesis B2 protein [Rhizobiaceae bacterium]|nr:lasso peptide biosynthesis B2 protein [Rhizobiaceae bacterium]
MKALRRFLALNGSEMLFLAGCVATVAAVRLGLTVLSYRRMRAWFPVAPAQGVPTAGDLRRVAWGVRNAARLVPRASCLTQALAGQFILARQGNSSRVRIGVARDDQGRFLAHAWLVSEDRIVLGGAEQNVRGFTPLTDLDWKRP